MKTLIEMVRQNQVINECGGYVGSIGGCGGGGSYGCGGYSGGYDWDKYYREREKKAKKIPNNIVKDYKDLLKELNGENDLKRKASMDADKTMNDLEEMERRQYGVSEIVTDLRDLVFSKQVLYRTHTQTADILKMLTYILSEEYTESGRNQIDPKTIQALEKIQTML